MEVVRQMTEEYYPGSPKHVIRWYQDTVYRVALTYCKNAHDAEDVTQEVILKSAIAVSKHPPTARGTLFSKEG